jgi:hypothetical protein
MLIATYKRDLAILVEASMTRIAERYEDRIPLEILYDEAFALSEGIVSAIEQGIGYGRLIAANPDILEARLAMTVDPDIDSIGTVIRRHLQNELDSVARPIADATYSAQFPDDFDAMDALLDAAATLVSEAEEAFPDARRPSSITRACFGVRQGIREFSRNPERLRHHAYELARVSGVGAGSDFHEAFECWAFFSAQPRPGGAYRMG